MLSADIRQEIPIIRQVTGSAAASQPSPDRAGMARPSRAFGFYNQFLLRWVRPTCLTVLMP